MSFIIHSSLVIIFCVFLFFNTLSILDNQIQDRLYHDTRPIHGDIVIIAIDEESLQTLGRWPWPRDYHGELLSVLSEAPPAVIGYDIIFAEPSFVPADDTYLIEMLNKMDHVVVPVVGHFENTSAGGLLQAKELTRAFPALALVTDSGHINTLLDSDGILRHTLLQIGYNDQEIPSFAWQIYASYMAHLGKEPIAIQDIPTDPWKQTYIKFAGEPFSMERVSFHLVMNGAIPAEYFRDKIVLIGPFAPGIVDDYYFTSIAPPVPMYGIEVHANVIQQLIEKRFIQDLPLTLELLILIALGALCYWLFYRFRPGVSALIFLVLSCLYWFIAVKISHQGYAFSLIYPVGLMGTQYIAALGHQFISEQLEKNRITSYFGKYVAPQVVSKIIDEGEDALKPGGVLREITVFFVDIRGFTSLSEAAPPDEVVAILNEYLTLCAQSIFDYGGTLDKFIGDATMALFNAPLDLENHQLKAVQTAWAMSQGAEKLQIKLEEKYGKSVQFGIGIHCGPAIVGNIGAAWRMDYTAIGDTVNIASRIENQTKPGEILISHDVYEHVKNHIEAVDMGIHQLKGKKQGVHVFRVESVSMDHLS
ncbi:CHASE2 domain-containing protein [Natronincola peptidivorans]|uniref:CHASE2 domain-containing protein n=1 Tax=Natronincola peptidivorans TaxID=426128 RepID=UPI001AD8D3E9|nr:adenylate/guanylate cyclase domain-containing protein [Natronincola peptidivorans]